jgi:hypothetical protein
MHVLRDFLQFRYKIINEFEKNIAIIEKKKLKFDFKGKIKNYKNFEKKTKKKNINLNSRYLGLGQLPSPS